MIVSRHTFLGHLAAAFGESCTPDLRKRIEDVGRPILLTRPAPAPTLHIYEGGCLTFGLPSADGGPCWRNSPV